MPQSVNWPAIRTTARVLLRQPALALPHVEVRTIADLDFKRLRRAGCCGVVFDKDNTLTAPYVDTIEPSLAAALSEARISTVGAVAGGGACTRAETAGAAPTAAGAAMSAALAAVTVLQP